MLALDLRPGAGRCVDRMTIPVKFIDMLAASEATVPRQLEPASAGAKRLSATPPAPCSLLLPCKSTRGAVATATELSSRLGVWAQPPARTSDFFAARER